MIDAESRPRERPLRARGSRRIVRGGAPLVCLAAAACSDGLIDADDGPALVEAAGAEVQFAPPSATAPDPLRVAVRRRSDLAPVVDGGVVWDVIEGEGAVVSERTSRTDSAGIASATVRLGARKGRYTVRARAGDAATDFELWAVDAPVLDSVPARAAPGETLRLRGRNFSPVAAHDAVTFGAVPAKVVQATATELTVEVPPCLPAEPTAVRVALGRQTSAPATIAIGPGAVVEALGVGKSLLLDGGGRGAAACRRLESGSYLLVLASTGAVSGASYPVAVEVLPARATSAAAATTAPTARRDVPSDPQSRWDAALRADEQRWLREPGSATRPEGPPVASAAVAPPKVGDRREFEVVQPGGGFRRVAATVRWIGARGVLYEDQETPSGQLTPADYAGFGAAFEDPIAPTVTRLFGEPTDLDGNGRVAVLFTPAVNRLTERQSTNGFIGGFFYGIDLLPERAHSNRGEVIYAVVPDPSGSFGDPRSRELVLSTVPTILAHELLHLAHYSQRVVGLGAAGSEPTWIAEGLAGMAEDRVGDAYAARGEGEVAEAFHSGNRKRARLFLESHGAISLITASGGATLAERGASWMFVRYLTEHYGGDALLSRLTRTTSTGIESVMGATGRDWTALVLEWATAVYDAPDPGVTNPLFADARNRFPLLRPRQTLVVPGQGYPLRPITLGPGGQLSESALLAGGVRYYSLGLSGPTSLTVRGSAGSTLPASAGVSLRVLRLR